VLVNSRGTTRRALLTVRGRSAVPLGIFLVIHGGSSGARGTKGVRGGQGRGGGA
jgi:hypothetical protein